METPPQEQMGSFISGTPMPTQDEKTMGLLAHMGTILANFVGLGFAVPLVLMLTKGKESSFVRAHAVESLNFQITVFIAAFVSAITVCIGIGAVLLPIVGIVAIVFSIIAGLKANEGQLYKYPVNIRLVK
ncbi:hypothetical protein BHS06_19900 [Myxococcus xanthus]|uniref:DUF4870 domain-containing protein n=1 Tax=Myxococcus xanthus TaxID=34 RepID=A0A4Y6CBK0_MYXXA|nr:DUF4870 domain-containing protein [Myxococcus xanthus]NOJ91181.1 DUF4870 domain-containing protein [Myxococcus xanthus]QDE91048.1 hypothetical protein BHS06_19900 [Myxococcus xanthus]